MKKAAVILLMCLFLFNWLGYRLLTAYWENKADTNLQARIDGQQYEESQLVSMKIPARHISSYSNNRSFESVEGEVQIRGTIYKYVKRRFCEDSLEYLCLPNHTAMNLETARDDFFKLINDLQHNGPNGKSNQHSGFSKNFSGEYYSVNEGYSLTHQRYSTIIPGPAELEVPIRHCYSLTAEQPPDLFS